MLGWVETSPPFSQHVYWYPENGEFIITFKVFYDKNTKRILFIQQPELGYISSAHSPGCVTWYTLYVIDGTVKTSCVVLTDVTDHDCGFTWWSNVSAWHPIRWTGHWKRSCTARVRRSLDVAICAREHWHADSETTVAAFGGVQTVPL